jgi:uncharacterized membrane protein
MSHPPANSTDKHPKQDFQVERIAFFSDAVFAIALTLLIIEFRPPHASKETTNTQLWHELLKMKFQLASLLLSFVLIVSYWMRHHTLFKYVHNYNKEIIVSNMSVLFPIIFFPFTTAFLYESVGEGVKNIEIPFRLFMLNNVLAGITTYYFYKMITRKYKEISYPMEKKVAQEFEVRLLIMSLSFLLVFSLSFISFEAAMIGLAPMAILNFYHRILKKDKNKKTNVEQEHSAAHN